MIRQGEEAFPALANKKIFYLIFQYKKERDANIDYFSHWKTVENYAFKINNFDNKFLCYLIFSMSHMISNFKHLKMQKILHRFPTIFCWTIAVLLGIYKKTVFWWKFLSWMHQHSKQQLNKHTHWARNYKNSWKEIFFFMEYFP